MAKDDAIDIDNLVKDADSESGPLTDLGEDQVPEPEPEPEPVEAESEPKPEPEGELNPAKEVTGYRMLGQDEIAWMNTCKQAELDLAAVCVNVKELAPSVDPRHWALARTHFEIGFMYLVRSIAQPEDPFDVRA